MARDSEKPFRPAVETINWLYRLPLPPGCHQTPAPQTPQDWALVEQYRLLCQSLTVLGDYERARRAEGLKPVDWKDLYLPDMNGQRSSGIVPTPTSFFDEPLSSHEAVSQLSKTLSSFPSHSFTFTSSGSISDGSLSLDLSLPLDLDSTEGPASLPTLMTAISELETCVARLSLEAHEARNLQKSLRTEMQNRHRDASMRQIVGGTGAVGGGGLTKGDAVGKNGNSISKQTSSNLSKKNGKKPEKRSSPPSESLHHSTTHQTTSKASKTVQNGERSVGEGGNDERALSIREVLAGIDVAHEATIEVGRGGAAEGGLGVKAWEDRELMKALESVSMLDKRADEYRERLRVLKEQIHHHAALADALQSPSSSPSSRSNKPNRQIANNGQSRSTFGDVASDTGLNLVHLTRPKPR